MINNLQVNGEPVGKFFVNNDEKLDFEGDATAAGRLFAEYVCKSYNNYYQSQIEDAKHQVAKDIIQEIRAELFDDTHILGTLRYFETKYKVGDRWKN